MRSPTPRTILLAASFVLMLPAIALAETSAGWIAPGGGVVWPPAEYGTDDPLGTFGAIAGLRMTPSWAFELRMHSAKGGSAKFGGAHTSFLRGEGNLTKFFLAESRFSPYLTGGAGAVRVRRPGTSDKHFAWNAGAGFRITVSDHLSLRVDARDVSYQVADFVGAKEYRHASEGFACIS